MSKDAFADWDATSANNLDVGGISIAEGMTPGSVNNALREIMGQLATWRLGALQFPGITFDQIDGAYPTDTSLVHVSRAATGNPLGTVGHLVLQSDPAADRSVVFVTGTTPTLRAQINSTGLAMSVDGTAAAPGLSWDTNDGLFHSSNSVGFTTEGVRRAFVRNDGFWCVGKAADGGIEDAGCVLGTDGNMVVTRSGAAPLTLNRLVDDGAEILFYEQGVLAGSVSVAGGVVTYGSFCGSHWSQFNAQIKLNVLPGTILETVNKMCEWPEEGIERVLPMVRIAKARSPSVYGVFIGWDEGSRDMHVAALGTNLVRIAPGVHVALGDLITSDSNGCGVPQGDDIFRACTVAKVTAAIPADTYEDGSYTVPCSLHCG